MLFFIYSSDNPGVTRKYYKAPLQNRNVKRANDYTNREKKKDKEFDKC